jgi:tetratricopeptide (TPR) repeat protein
MAGTRKHRYSEGQGFDDPSEGFDLGEFRDLLPEDPRHVDPVDSHALPDILDRESIVPEGVDLEALLDVGLGYISIEQYEQAIDTFARVIWFADEDAPIAQEAWVNKGVAHAQLEEYDEAIGAYREALRIDDDSEFATVAETNLAYALWEAGHTGPELEHAERAVELDQHQAEAWLNLGFLYNERGLGELALEALDNALTLGMRASWVHDERARALETVEREREAELAREQAAARREGGERRFAEAARAERQFREARASTERSRERERERERV